MKLYSPLSTYSQKVRIAIAEKGLDIDTEKVNLMSPEACRVSRGLPHRQGAISARRGRPPRARIEHHHRVPRRQVPGHAAPVGQR